MEYEDHRQVELLRFQGFPDSFKIVVSHAEIRKQTGNCSCPYGCAVQKKECMPPWNKLNNMST